jgi:hypothetical protein
VLPQGGGSEKLPPRAANGSVVIDALITIAAILAGLVVIAFANAWWASRQRRRSLRAEYGADPLLAQRLIAREICAGLSAKQLVDAQGAPSAKTPRQQDG